MSDDDPALDRPDVLSAIDQAVPTEEFALPEPEPAAEVPAPVAAAPAPSAWMRHRHEAAALVTAFVAIVWIAAGLAMGAWVPGLLGLLFAGGAACIKAYAPPVGA
jgi:hypothetical protein